MILLLLLFFLPFQTQWILRSGMLRGEQWQYGTIGIFAVDILIVVLALIDGWKAFNDGGPKGILLLRKFGTIGWWIAALFACILFSIVPSQDKAVAWLHTFWVAEAIALGCIIAHATKDRLMRIAFCVGSVFQAFIGLWQFFTQSTIASSLLGVAAHPIWGGGTSVIEIAGERWLRAYAGFPHPNFFGGYMAGAMVILVGLIVSETRIQARRIFLGMLVVLSAGLAVSFSRSAMLAVGVGITILALLSTLRHGRHTSLGQSEGKKLLLSFGIILISIITVLFPYRALFQTRVEHSTRLEQLSLNEREQQYAQAWELIRAQRWGRAAGYRGVTGIGNYTNAVSGRHPELPAWNIQPVHNAFVLMAAEIHGSSLIWVLLILYYCLKRALGITPLSSFKRHFWKQLRDPQSALPLALLGTLLLLLLFDHYLWSLHTGLLLWGTAFGFIVGDQKTLDNKE